MQLPGRQCKTFFCKVLFTLQAKFTINKYQAARIALHLCPSHLANSAEQKLIHLKVLRETGYEFS